MKVTELMVGDYIMFDGSPYIIEEISVKGWIHILHINNKSRVALSSNYILDFIEGIPLTPEILEKNGFGRYGSCIYILENDDFTIQIRIGKYVRVFRGMDCNAKFDTDFTVHKFQHALRLCGIEKEIVL